MKIAAFSDSHWKLDKLVVPDADVVVCAGDWSVSNGSMSDLLKFGLFVKNLKAKHKLIIAGNHDWIAEQSPDMTKQVIEEAGGTYLCDSGVTIDNINFWGSPWSPEFMRWAFMKPDYELSRVYGKIPNNTDVLITHSPPYGTLDRLPDYQNVGSQALEERIKSLKPAVHIFGHIHCGYGAAYSDNTAFYNVSVCDDDYNLVNKPTIIEV